MGWTMQIGLTALVVFAGFGTFWSYFQLPHNANPALRLKFNNSTNSYLYDEKYFYDSVNTTSYDELQRAAEEASDYYKDVRFYAVVPCGVAFILALKLSVASLVSPHFLATTHVCFNLVGVWISTLLLSVVYQLAVPRIMRRKYNDDGTATFLFITLYHVGLLAIVTALVCMAVWELRRKKVEWPCINWSMLFSINTYAIVARVVLAVYCIVFFSGSDARNGYRELPLDRYMDYWSGSAYKVPGWVALGGAVVLVEGVVAASEHALSQLFGHSHTRWVGVSALLSSLGYGVATVIMSPSFLAFNFPGQYGWGTDILFNFDISCTCVSGVHGILLLACPTKITSSWAPFVIKHVLELPSKWEKTSSTISSSVSSPYQRLPVDRNLVFHSVVLILAVTAQGFCIRSLGCAEWGISIMMAGLFAVMIKHIPLTLGILYAKPQYKGPLLETVLTMILMVIGATGTFFTWPRGTEITAAVLTLLIVLLQGKLLFKSADIRRATSLLLNEGTPQPRDATNSPATDSFQPSDDDRENIIPAA